MTKEEWTREVEAQWTEIANVFYPIDLIITCIDPELGDPESPNRYIHELEGIQPKQLTGTFYAGLDMGKQIDHSVLAVIQKTDNKRRLIYKYQFPLGTPYPSVIAHVTKTNQTFQFTKLIIDKTGVGDAITDEIKQIGIQNSEGLFLTDRWKEEIFTYLKLIMEQKRLSILPDDTPLITQINEQRHEYLKPKQHKKEPT